jgi:predicted ATPase
MEAHRALGATLIEAGRCSDALEHLDRASSLYPANRNHPHTLAIAHDCKVVSECFAARALWALGDPDDALERMHDALAFAKELSHPPSWLFATHFAAQLHQLRGEPLVAYERAREVAKLADEYGLDLWVAVGDIDLGWAEAELGNAQQGIEQMQRGLAAYEATGGKLWLPHFLGLLAGELGKAGRVEDGLAAIAKALTLVEDSGERYAMAELYRIKGELTIHAGELPQASTLPENTSPKSAACCRL